VHRELDLAAQQRLLELLNEARLVERPASGAVAGGRYRDELRLDAVLAGERVGDRACLGER
jgi:hypothetical protein